IASDQTTLNTIIRHLDENTMITVTDILENPPEMDKYNKLKETLIARFTDSQEKQMQMFLLDIELGDKKSSQLLREIRTLAGQDTTESFLHTLW
ncbi:hypothetical protein ALC56_09144, partial [Trachymyrmex septentrionalis]